MLKEANSARIVAAYTPANTPLFSRKNAHPALLTISGPEAADSDVVDAIVVSFLILEEERLQRRQRRRRNNPNMMNQQNMMNQNAIMAGTGAGMGGTPGISLGGRTRAGRHLDVFSGLRRHYK